MRDLLAKAAAEKPTLATPVLSRAARTGVKRGERPRKKTAVTLAEPEAMLAASDDSTKGLRDRALLFFGFASGTHLRSEIASADLRDLRRIGEAGYIYRPERSKTQQAGVRATSTPDKPVLDPRPSGFFGWLKPHRGVFPGGCGNSGSALPRPRPPWVRSCSGGRAWPS